MASLLSGSCSIATSHHGYAARCKQYLDDMATTFSSLTSRAEKAEAERLHATTKLFQAAAGASINDINAALTDQQLSNVLTDAQRENASLLDQKRLCIERHVANINHIRRKLRGTNSGEDRARYEDILAVMEDMAVDDECKWDLDKMSHWFDSFMKPSAKCVKVNAVANSSHVPQHVLQTPEPTHVPSARPGAPQKTIGVGDSEPELQESMVVRALELYGEEVRDHLSLKLTQVQEEIATLR